ncbi:hypothetical protein LNV23_20305 [Paucibacter sp. DJ1R-11]|uniref:hypothetical protein n=1 Tax=Paucibacter sp. DJ1R-11 TaxID=2893556 RepID=UPI0021E3BD3B|nr:hypothetical protein [Paucibacter sp. DJ1R-11]MCV2365798.1 hypothetical protein [Paucibacter sp. DJ1R-11]
MRLYAHDSSLLCSPSLWHAPETLAQIGALLAPLQLSVGHLVLYPARSGRPAGPVYETELAALHRRFKLDQAERRHSTRRELPQTRTPTLAASGSEFLLLMEGQVTLLLQGRDQRWTLQLDAGDWAYVPARLLLRLQARPSLNGADRVDLLHWREAAAQLPSRAPDLRPSLGAGPASWLPLRQPQPVAWPAAQARSAATALTA